MKVKHIIGIVIIVIFAIYAATSFESAITPYVSIEEAIESGDFVQVKGQREGSGDYDIEKSVFTFNLKDDKGNKIHVIFSGAKPGNFEQATEVVCKGEYKEGVFHANVILVKCPSKYVETEITEAS